jgi:pimeloyl-ACP methyl ester carboxylesterase
VVGQALYDDLVTDMRPDLSKIQVPVTILYPWDDSAGVPQTVTDSLYKGAFARLPQAKVERIDGSAHFIMIDQPELFLQQVDAFLLR